MLLEENSEVPPGRCAPRPACGGLVTGTCPAWAAEVVSSNIVGYNRVSLTEGFNLLGAQFVNVGGQIQDIQDFIASDTTLLGLDDDGMFQSELLVWNGQGYTTYGWLDADDGTNNEVPEWNNSWLLYDMSDLASVNMTPGMGCWIKSGADAVVSFKGEVPSATTVTQNLTAGFNLLSNPFPAALPIQAVQSDDLPGLDDDGMFQTELLVWNGQGYTTYGWLDADDGTNNEVPEWNNSWLLYDMSDLANVTIDMGKGFWIKPATAASVVFRQ